MSAGAGISGRPYPYTPPTAAANPAPVTAGEKLDQFLGDAINELGAKKMPETDAKPATLAEAMQAIKDAANDVKQQALQQAEQMRRDINDNGALVLKKMQTMHQDAIAELNAVLGNERAGDEG
ncbi:hypothetical protein I6F35_33665 [Bradyrhizobium sp. BRP22]|uniref:hypothetical protein n=1 Tax=Bradyrhizobium sp. BRP22 TaxID=2793821 RepID=UPI001CD54701|nr:hypothetical protein [Bradyrhizobium sp. BRP22]MCA1458084.1 hypothetical protein [Bradyrhizobium sp. BRP22]